MQIRLIPCLIHGATSVSGDRQRTDKPSSGALRISPDGRIIYNSDKSTLDL